MAKRKLGVLLGAFLYLFSLHPALADKLDAFEQSAQEKPAESVKKDTDEGHHHHRKKDCSDKGNDDCSADVDFYTFIFQVAALGGLSSYQRINPPPKTDTGANNLGVEPRQIGEPQIPFLRFDYAYQPYHSDVSAHDYRLELGYGPMAVAVDKTHYLERNPTDTLDITRVYGVYRMSFGSLFEMDLGLGTLSLKGNSEHSYSYFTIPLQIYFDENLGFEFRPAWAGNINDYDTGVFLNYHSTAFKFGYRVVETDTQSLGGYYFGFSTRY